MSIKAITVHSFTNGAALFDFGEGAAPDKIEEFREYWNRNKKRRDLTLFFGGAPVVVVEHATPFGPDYTFDALSHAFGSMGWYVEDEQINGLIEGLRTFMPGASDVRPDDDADVRE